MKLIAVMIFLGFLLSHSAYAVSVDPGVISNQLSQENMYNQSPDHRSQEPLIIYERKPLKQGPVVIDKNQKYRDGNY